MKIKIVSLVFLFALLVSCAGYRPVIDPASVQDEQTRRDRPDVLAPSMPVRGRL